MQVYYDGEKAKIINDRLFSKFNEDKQKRTTVHLSDTVHCEMKCYNRLIGMEETITPESGAAMLFGQVGQELLQILYPKEQCEYSVEGEIPLHIDIFEDMKYPLEIKWSAQKIFRASDIPKGWLLQLMGYMGLTNSTIGWMVIVNIFSRQITTFKIIMTEEECKEQVQRIKESRERILKAAKDRNPSELIVDTNECNWCSYKPTRSKKKDGTESCPSYAPKVQNKAEDLPPSAS